MNLICFFQSYNTTMLVSMTAKKLSFACVDCMQHIGDFDMIIEGVKSQRRFTLIGTYCSRSM